MIEKVHKAANVLGCGGPALTVDIVECWRPVRST